LVSSASSAFLSLLSLLTAFAANISTIWVIIYFPVLASPRLPNA
jgi:hypothetical protein